MSSLSSVFHLHDNGGFIDNESRTASMYRPYLTFCGQFCASGSAPGLCRPSFSETCDSETHVKGWPTRPRLQSGFQNQLDIDRDLSLSIWLCMSSGPWHHGFDERGMRKRVNEWGL